VEGPSPIPPMPCGGLATTPRHRRWTRYGTRLPGQPTSCAWSPICRRFCDGTTPSTSSGSCSTGRVLRRMTLTIFGDLAPLGRRSRRSRHQLSAVAGNPEPRPRPVIAMSAIASRNFQHAPSADVLLQRDHPLPGNRGVDVAFSMREACLLCLTGIGDCAKRLSCWFDPAQTTARERMRKDFNR